jgi:hypothetical protein
MYADPIHFKELASNLISPSLLITRRSWLLQVLLAWASSPLTSTLVTRSNGQYKLQNKLRNYPSNARFNRYLNTNNFLRNVRNFKMDITRTDPGAYVCAIHWQVAQGTTLENIEFYMSQADGNTQQVYRNLPIEKFKY